MGIVVEFVTDVAILLLWLFILTPLSLLFFAMYLLASAALSAGAEKRDESFGNDNKREATSNHYKS